MAAWKKRKQAQQTRLWLARGAGHCSVTRLQPRPAQRPKPTMESLGWTHGEKEVGGWMSLLAGVFAKKVLASPRGRLQWGAMWLPASHSCGMVPLFSRNTSSTLDSFLLPSPLHPPHRSNTPPSWPVYLISLRTSSTSARTFSALQRFRTGIPSLPTMPRTMLPSSLSTRSTPTPGRRLSSS